MPRVLHTGPVTLETLATCPDNAKFPFELLAAASGVWYVSQPEAGYQERAHVKTSNRAHNWNLTRRDVYFEVPILDDDDETAAGCETWHGVLYGEGTTFYARPLGRAERRRKAALARRRSLKATGLVPCARCDTPVPTDSVDIVGYCLTCSEIVREYE